jgi:hypothetical protein
VDAKVNIINSHELIAGRKYLIVFDDRSITKADAATVNSYINDELGIEGITVMVRGDVNEAVTVVDVTKKPKPL